MPRAFLSMLGILFLSGCSKETHVHPADKIFCLELQKRGIPYSINPQGLYVLQVNGQPLSVSLENVRRNYERDSDAAPIARFVGATLSNDFKTPSWHDARSLVRYSLEPANYESGFNGVAFDRVSDELYKVYVYVSADGSKITWINDATIREWGVRREEVVQEAENNMRMILNAARLETREIDGVKLGMLNTEETPFKASLILSPAFRVTVGPTLGWPVFAVVPCRDFLFLIAEKDRHFLGRLGKSVMNEYQKSGYPITQDVLRLSDEGIKAIGTFADREQSHLPTSSRISD